MEEGGGQAEGPGNKTRTVALIDRKAAPHRHHVWKKPRGARETRGAAGWVWGGGGGGGGGGGAERKNQRYLTEGNNFGR